jgi:hypothetical protein
VNHRYPEIKLVPITLSKLQKILPKLEGHKFDVKLFEVINSKINEINILSHQKNLSNNQILNELKDAKKALSKANKHIRNLSKNTFAEKKCDYFYQVVNDNDNSMVKLSLQKDIKENIEHSGCAQVIEKIENGINAYIGDIQITSGRDKNLTHIQLVISILQVFQINGFPYKITKSPSGGLVTLLDTILQQDSRNVLKNAIENQSKLRPHYSSKKWS